MLRAVQSAAIFALVALLALGCGGRFSRDEDLSAAAGRASVVAEGGAPGASGAGNVLTGTAGTPSAGAPSAGAPSTCQTTEPAPTGMPGTSEPGNVTGRYDLVACGQDTPCTPAGTPATPVTLNDHLELSVAQDANDLSHGTVTLRGTGELLLDGRALPAVFSGRSFKVELSGPINAVCNQEFDLSFAYDFAGYGPRTLNWNFERSPTCSGNGGGVDCKGNVHSAFGDAVPVVE